VSPGTRVSVKRPLQGSARASGSWHFFYPHFIILLHSPVDAGESLCVAFNAWIHASEGAHVLHDHVGRIEFRFYSKCLF
jgi:hypothetical protein